MATICGHFRRDVARRSTRLPARVRDRRMCRAAGPRAGRTALERMAGALRHRGPDDQGIEVVGNAGLVHTRLSIVDPSPAGHEPMSLGDRWWLTYNGEVFNHLELRGQLGDRDWRGGSDTETLLRALAAWDEEAIRAATGCSRSRRST